MLKIYRRLEAGIAPRAGDRPLPDRRRRLRAHAAAPGLDRARRRRRHADRPMPQRSTSSPTRATAGSSPSTISTGCSSRSGTRPRAARPPAAGAARALPRRGPPARPPHGRAAPRLRASTRTTRPSPREPVAAADLEAWLADARGAGRGRLRASLERLRTRAPPRRWRPTSRRHSPLRPAVEAALASARGTAAGPGEDPAARRLPSGPGRWSPRATSWSSTSRASRAAAGRAPRPRARRSRDVAGMLRSFDYAAWAGVFRFAESDPAAFEQLLAPALVWRDLRAAPSWTSTGQRSATARAGPPIRRRRDAAAAALHGPEALLRGRLRGGEPARWLRIPLAGIRDLFGNERRQEGETSGSTG